MAVKIERLDLPATALGQTVSWSTEENRPVSLSQFMASRNPEVAARFGITPSDKPVKAAWELTDEELKKTVITRIRESTKGTKLMVVGRGFSLEPEDVMRGIEDNTALGQRITDAVNYSLRLIEGLAIDGRIFPKSSE